MSKIAIDIVLLPPEKITVSAIRLSRDLISSSNRKIRLNVRNCIPHISLAMGCIRKKDLPAVENQMRKLSLRYLPLRLQIEKIYKKSISGMSIVGLKIENTKKLQEVHEEIINTMSEFFTCEAAQSSLHGSSIRDEFTLSWINNYIKRNSFENFFSHITLGFGRSIQKRYKAAFTCSRVAICHLGNYCTCKKILWGTTVPIG